MTTEIWLDVSSNIHIHHGQYKNIHVTVVVGQTVILLNLEPRLSNNWFCVDQNLSVYSVCFPACFFLPNLPPGAPHGPTQLNVVQASRR